MDAMNEQLMKELGLDALAPEEKALITEKFADTLFQAVLIRGTELLPEDKKDLLEEALKKDEQHPQDVMMNFFMQHIPNFQSVVDQEVGRVKEHAISITGSSKG